MFYLWGRFSETAAKLESEEERWHDASSPGNPAFRAGPSYYQVSLQDDKDLSPIGAIDSSLVL